MEQRDRAAEPELICVRRNPYLVDYERERSRRDKSQRELTYTGENVRTAHSTRPRPERGTGQNSSAVLSGGKRYSADRTGQGALKRQVPAPKRLTAAKRRKRARLQRCFMAAWVVLIAALGIHFFVRNDRAAAAENNQGYAAGQDTVGGDNGTGQPDALTVQGLPAAEFAKHPEWEENFLTPNEYSRPGEPLEQVTNIFVHYTANPGTSAAQNRSYFERQKDEHLASVSSHFIIGYDGEIIQCVPLDEIAYAVRSRNYDSVSIECCYKAQDGSFTQETYDSLISLLAWLIDIYDLDTEDILRHYDCGGKKCPLYYTEHEDAWELLKKDVGEVKL